MPTAEARRNLLWNLLPLWSLPACRLFHIGMIHEAALIAAIAKAHAERGNNELV